MSKTEIPIYKRKTKISCLIKKKLIRPQKITKEQKKTKLTLPMFFLYIKELKYIFMYKTTRCIRYLNKISKFN